MVAAPVLEELVFRGVLQPWFAGRPWGGHLALASAFLLALLARRERIVDAWHAPGGAAGTLPGWPLLDACVPALFIAALVPFYLLTCRPSRRPAVSRAEARSRM